MAFEMNNNTGSIFKNKRKEKEKHPDRTGKIKVDGKEYWLSGWIKKKDDGEQCAELRDGDEGGPVLGVLAADQAHGRSREREMSCAADWDELGEALDQPEKQRLPE